MVMLATGLIVAYGYVIEAFMSWYSGNRYDAFMLWNRLHGPYASFYYSLLFCNIGLPAVALDQQASHQAGLRCSSSRWTCWSACGWSASSSSWSACIATS